MVKGLIRESVILRETEGIGRAALTPAVLLDEAHNEGCEVKDELQNL